MRKKLRISFVLVVLLLTGVLGMVMDVGLVGAGGTIYIRADGSVDPPTAPISTVDNVNYVLTGNINDEIVVERSNIIINGNTYTVQASSPSYGIGFTIDNIDGVTIRNTNIKDFAFGIFVNRAPNCIISRNNITNNGLEPTWGAGIILYSWDCKITGNKIAANNMYGIDLRGASNCSVSGNNITANNRQGITFDTCANCEIIGNNITANNREGIIMVDSFTNTVSRNNITNNNVGALLFDCHNNTISENNITHNLLAGIWLDGESYDNTIVGNNITFNDCGMHVTNTTYANSIYHNNFINNTLQAYSEGWNVWDDGYPSGGNYWSDYEERYPDAKELDGSGIWDTPYVILASEVDRYPRMNPMQYVVTIRAYCQMNEVFVELLITWMDNLRARDYTTPHTFRLAGTHTFTVQCVDPHGHQLDKWNTGRLFQTVEVNSGGTYTAYYKVVARSPGGNGGSAFPCVLHHLYLVK